MTKILSIEDYSNLESFLGNFNVLHLGHLNLGPLNFRLSTLHYLHIIESQFWQTIGLSAKSKQIKQQNFS